MKNKYDQYDDLFGELTNGIESFEDFIKQKEEKEAAKSAEMIRQIQAVMDELTWLDNRNCKITRKEFEQLKKTKIYPLVKDKL